MTLHTTLTTNGEDILRTLKTNGEDTLTTPMMDGEDTLMIQLMTTFVTTLHDVTDDPCDDIDDLYEPKILMSATKNIDVGYSMFHD